jgi:MFS family permease
MKKQPLLTPILRWFMFAMILANIAGSMSPLVMPIYLTTIGASIEQVGLVYTISSVAILLLQVFGGWISDSIGRLRAIAFGSIGGIIGFIALLLAPNWQWMILALVIYQIPFAIVGPSFSAFIAENSSEENRGKVYGITGTIYQVTGVLGPPLGSWLAGAHGFKFMLLMSAIVYAMAAVLRIWMATTMHSAQEKLSGGLTVKTFRKTMGTMLGMLFAGGVITWILITDGVSDMAFRLSDNLQPLYLSEIGHIPVEMIGWLGSINALAVMFVPILSGRLSDKRGERYSLVAGFGMIFVAFLVFLQAKSFVVFAISWAIFGVGGGMLGPAYQSLISKVVPKKLLGTFSGVFSSSIGLISLAGPWLGSKLWETFSPKTPFIITAVAALLVTIPVWFKFRVPKNPSPPRPDKPAVLEEVPVE